MRNNIFLVTILTLSLSLVACKGEKYKAYEEQQKQIDLKKSQEATKTKELNAVEVSLLEDVIETNNVPTEEYLYSLEKDKKIAIDSYQRFEELLQSNPVEAAKNLTIALNPWSEKLVKGDISTSANPNVDKYGILTSDEIPANIYQVFGNRTQQLIIQLGVNLLQAKIRESGKIANESNFKQVMAALLFYKKAELEVQAYIKAVTATAKKEESKVKNINETLVKAKKYLELAFSLTKYIVTQNKDSLEKLKYAYKYENLQLDVFAKDSEKDLMSFILAENDNAILNGAFNLLRTKNAFDQQGRSINSTKNDDKSDPVEEDVVTTNSEELVDVSNLSNSEILELTKTYLIQNQKKKD